MDGSDDGGGGFSIKVAVFPKRFTVLCFVVFQ